MTTTLQDPAILEAVIARRTKSCEAAFITRTDSKVAMAVWQLEVSILDHLTAQR